MDARQVIDALSGRQKSFEPIDRDLDHALEQQAEDGMNLYYGDTGNEIQANWQQIQSEMKKGPGHLKKNGKSIDVAEGLGLLPLTAEGVKRGKMYDVDGSVYSVFYIEPSNDTEVVANEEGANFIGTPYVIGETYQIQDSEIGDVNFTRAEKRSPKVDPKQPLERPSEKFY